jgi:hypothetical protein
MHLLRRAAVATCVAVTALGVVAVSPAAADSRPTHRQVVRALLTADQLPNAWHRTTDDSSGGDLQQSGCESGRSRGVVRTASRSFQYGQQPLFADETVLSFRTLRTARLDVRRGIAALADCDSLTVDGHPWTVQRLKMFAIGDQQALFEIKGFVTTADGDVLVTSWLGVARVGHHVTSTMLTVGGPVADEDLGTLRDSGRGILSKAMARVPNTLGV